MGNTVNNPFTSGEYGKRSFLHGAPMNPDGSELTMKDWLGEPEEFDHIDEELYTDVVVVGGGIAGVSAVRSAVENGADVVLMEKCLSIQGRSGDFAVVGAEKQKEWWGLDSSVWKEDILRSFMRDMSYRNNFRMFKYWLDNNGSDFDWYVEADPDVFVAPESLTPAPAESRYWIFPERTPLPEDYDFESEYFNPYPVTLRFAPTHMPMTRANLRIAEEKGRVTKLFDTPAKRLIRDEEGGRVSAVIGRRISDGKVIKVNAKKGIVMSTGDYASNEAMRLYYVPWTRNAFVMAMAQSSDGFKPNMGDGHRMAMWIGAKMEEGPHGVISHCMGGPLGVTPYLLLDRNGERFMNEDVPGLQWGNQIEKLPGGIAYTIFDSAWPDQIHTMGAGHAAVVGIAPEVRYAQRTQRYHASDSYTNPAQVDAMVKSGRAFKADTLEELLDQLGLSETAKNTALASIERYNELARNGKDIDFGKNPRRLYPIERGPFYAGMVSGAAPILATLGGIECDHNLRAFDENRNIIPGLYFAGNCQGGRFPLEYPMILPGLSHSMCLCYGRLAGKNAALGI